MVILLHCSYKNNLLEINIETIIKYLTSIFVNYRTFLNLFLQSRLIDIMDWRASQLLKNLLTKDL